MERNKTERNEKLPLNYNESCSPELLRCFLTFFCVLSGFLTDSERFNLVLVPKIDIYFTLTAWANCGVRLNERRLAPAISDCLTIRKKKRLFIGLQGNHVPPGTLTDDS